MRSRQSYVDGCGHCRCIGDAIGRLDGTATVTMTVTVAMTADGMIVTTGIIAAVIGAADAGLLAQS